MSGDPAEPAPPPSLLRLGWSMFRLGLVSFGGNNALLMAHMVVDRRGWLTKSAMDDAIAMATLAPGGNSSNLSYEVGRRIRGVAGGLTSYASMAIPGVLIAVTLGAWILSITGNHVVHGALAGAEAAAVAMVFTVGVRLGRKVLTQPLDWALALVLFAVVGLLDWPLVLCFPPVALTGFLVRTKGWAK